MMMDTMHTHVTLSGAKATMPDFGSFATLRMTFPEPA
jgi:hypothetical protein